MNMIFVVMKNELDAYKFSINADHPVRVLPPGTAIKIHEQRVDQTRILDAAHVLNTRRDNEGLVTAKSCLIFKF